MNHGATDSAMAGHPLLVSHLPNVQVDSRRSQTRERPTQTQARQVLVSPYFSTSPLFTRHSLFIPTVKFFLGSSFQSSSFCRDTSSFFSIIWTCHHTSSLSYISCLSSKISSTLNSCTTSALSQLSPRTVKLSVEPVKE